MNTDVEGLTEIHHSTGRCRLRCQQLLQSSMKVTAPLFVFASLL
jgi:hypothetical protein